MASGGLLEILCASIVVVLIREARAQHDRIQQGRAESRHIGSSRDISPSNRAIKDRIVDSMEALEDDMSTEMLARVTEGTCRTIGCYALAPDSPH